jgi:hypothetical protein
MLPSGLERLLHVVQAVLYEDLTRAAKDNARNATDHCQLRCNVIHVCVTSFRYGLRALHQASG